MSVSINKSKTQMRRGVLELCVLSIIGTGEMYPSDILKEMRAADLILVEGTLYPMLTRLKNGGLLTYRWEESKSGPPRKYYTLTEDGVSFKDALQICWNTLVDAVNSTTQNIPHNEQNH